VKLPEWSEWPRVELAGETYAVAPRYIHGVGIFEAATLAEQMGCPLPWPALVDAIYAAADCKLAPLPRSERGPDMASVQTLAAQAERVQRQIDAWERAHGRKATLIAGTHKDVVRSLSGQLGLYGWHQLNGKPIQGPGVYTKHSVHHADYSQGLRLVLPLDADGNPRT